jgi:hypothetical protein
MQGQARDDTEGCNAPDHDRFSGLRRIADGRRQENWTSIQK